MDIVFLEGFAAGMVGGFVLYAILEGFIARKSLWRVYEEFSRKLEDAGFLVNRLGDVEIELTNLEKKLENMGIDLNNLRTRIDDIYRSAEEIERYLEDIDRIVTKKMKYHIHIRIEPEEEKR